MILVLGARGPGFEKTIPDSPYKKCLNLSQFLNRKKEISTHSTGFEPAREIPIDFKSIALTTRPRMPIGNKNNMLILNYKFIIKKYFIYCGKFINFFFLFSINKIKKRSCLYELREKLIFFNTILKFNLTFKEISIFPTNNHFISFQKILTYCSYYKEKKIKTSHFGKNKLNSFSDLWSIKKGKIIFGFFENKTSFSEIFVKNFILETRSKILKKLIFKIYPTLHEVSRNGSKKFLEFTKDIEKKLKFYGFSKNLAKKLICIFNQSFQNSLKEIEFISKNFKQKFFYWEEFIDFFKVYFMKNQINKINQIIPLMNLYYFRNKKGDKKVFVLRKFLNKLFKLKKIKKFNFKQPISSKLACKKGNNLIFFNFSKIKILFSPKFKCQKIFLEIFQKNLNLYLEFEKLTIKLSYSPYLKIIFKSIRPSINLDIYNLFLFKFLNLINVINSKILNTFFLLDKKFYQIYKKTNLPYLDFRKITLPLKKPYIFKNLSYFKNENIYLINMKLTQIINDLSDKMKINPCIKKNSILSSSKMHLKSQKRPKIKFLMRISNWDSLFQNRIKFLLFFFSDSFILKSKIRNFQFNGFDFRETGF